MLHFSAANNPGEYTEIIGENFGISYEPGYTHNPMDLFEKDESQQIKNAPLALRMRPQALEGFIGQKHILGTDKLLNRAIKSDKISSIILYGPPGCGKNCLAHIISSVTKSHFEELNAVTANVQDLRRIIDAAKKRKSLNGKRTILFLDEMHRFNKAQQDVLMPDVEKGDIILIGATTHNPFFSIVSPLLSRSQVFELKPLTENDIMEILKRAVSDKENGLGNLKLEIDENALAHLAKLSEGDARKALNALEIGALTTEPTKDAPSFDGRIHFTLKVAEESIQKKAVVYDHDEDGHYDTASAFIKSMRGSDPDAALYWLAKMLYAGEDPRFIARRVVICASEDVGNADPMALVLANAALQVSEFVGLPEARIPLAQAVTYIACAPKSNASYLAVDKAYADVEEGRTLEVPTHLKDASYQGAKQLGHGEGYKYAHDFKDHYVKQDYTTEKRRYYEPTDIGHEKKMKEYLDKIREVKHD